MSWLPEPHHVRRGEIIRTGNVSCLVHRPKNAQPCEADAASMGGLTYSYGSRDTR